MGIGGFFKKLLGGDAGGTTSSWAALEDADLDRLWRARVALTPATRLAVRDTFVARGRPFPYAGVASAYGPPLPAIDDVLEQEDLLRFLRQLDPHAREGDEVEVGPSWVAITGPEGGRVVVTLPTWGAGPAEAPTDGAALVVDLGTALAAPAAAAGLTVTPLDAPLPAVEVADDDGALRVLVGPAIPVPALVGEIMASHIVGGFAEDAEAREALEEVGWDPADVVDVVGYWLLPEVAGTGGEPASRTGVTIGVPTRVVGRGAPVGPGAQAAIVGAAVTTATLEEVVRWALTEEDDALLQRALDEVGEEAAPWRGLVHALRGDTEAALEAWSAGDPVGLAGRVWLAGVGGDLAAARDVGAAWDAEGGVDPVSHANVVLAAWASGDRDEAVEALQASQVSDGSWLGSLLDATAHEGDPEAEPVPWINPLAYHVGPLAAALDHLRAGGFDEAERLLRRCLALCPVHPAAAGTLARHLVESGRLEEALTHCDAVLEAAPRFAPLRAIRAGARLRTDDVDGAIADLEQCVSSVPDDTDRWIELVEALRRAGRTDDARRRIAELEAFARDMQLLKDLKRRLT